MTRAVVTTEEFVRLLARTEHEVYRYVYSLVPNVEDARDILQETAVALWRKREEYDPSQPFLPWACRFAYYEVQNFRKRVPRARFLSEEVLAMLAEESLERQDLYEARRRALEHCLARLRSEDLRLLEQRYWKPVSIKELAGKTQRSVHTLYKSLERVRRLLLECVNRTVAIEERA